MNTGHVAVGWPKIGNLRNIKPDRQAFKTKLIECYLDTDPRLMPIYASELFQFAYRIAIADVVVYPSLCNRQINLGQIVDAYQYDPSFSEKYPNLYPVQWLRASLDTQFTRRTLREIRFPITVSQIRNNAREIMAVLETQAND